MRPASEQLTAAGGLAERLAGLRSGAGLKAVQLAESLGWARSKVSKIENGNQVPSEGDIRAWTDATGHPEVTDELIAMLRQVQEAHTRWRRRLREGGQASIQAELDELTRAAGRIRNLQVAIIPGLLQTAGYAHGIATQVSAVYGNVDVDAAVAARIKRQEILYEPDRSFEFVFGEAALYMPPCPRAAMLGQLDRLMAMDLANITLGIIPMGAELSMSPLNSFMLLDDLLVVESYGYEDRVGGDLAETHARIFDMLMTESATGERARRLITTAAERLREDLRNGESHVRPASAELCHPAELSGARSRRWQPQANRLATDRCVHHRCPRRGSCLRLSLAVPLLQGHDPSSNHSDPPYARRSADGTVQERQHHQEPLRPDQQRRRRASSTRSLRHDVLDLPDRFQRWPSHILVPVLGCQAR